MSRTLHRRFAAFVLVALALGRALAQDEFTPPPELAAGWYARIETSLGRILARLHVDTAPQAVAHFAALAEGRLAWHDPLTGETKKGPYYDGILVHRSLAGQMFEAGLRPGARVAPEIWVPFEDKASRPFGHPGRLGMAAQPPGFSGAVFFVTAVPNRKLDARFPCFGTVVSDLEVVHRISAVPTRGNGRPIEPVQIEKVRIFSVGDPPPLPEPVPYKAQRVAIEGS